MAADCRTRLPALLLGLALAAPLTATAAAASSSDLDAVIDQSHKANSNDDFLPPEKAFRLSASADGKTAVKLDWVIAPGYYLYRDRIKIADDSGQIGATSFPEGQVKQDEYFGKQVVYHEELVARVPLIKPAGAQPLTLRVTYQGCAEAGLCYPPTTATLKISFSDAGGPAGTAAAPPPAQPPPPAQLPLPAQRQLPVQPLPPAQCRAPRQVSMCPSRTGSRRCSNPASLLEVLLKFFLGGVVLAFTPCVLPMVPILSGLIVGQGHAVSTARAFLLSLTYVLGMSLTYTVTGVAFAAAGKQVQAVFQQPWIIVLFAALFVAMALSMFGLFTVQMPSFIQTRVALAEQSAARRQLRRRRPHGRAVGAHRHHLRRSGAGGRTDRHRPDRRHGARRRGTVCHESRHGCPAAGGRQLGGALAAARRRLDGGRQAPVRRADAGDGGLDARRASCRTAPRCCCMPYRCSPRRWCCGHSAPESGCRVLPPCWPPPTACYC